jgi:hypothetical protein
MTTQKTRTRRARQGKAKAEQFIENKLGEALAEANAAPKPEPKKRASIDKQIAEAGCTKEAIEQARDGAGLSWADVAKAVGLSSPGAARKAYEALTGRSHNTSVMTGKRAPRGSRTGAGVERPQWDNDTDTDTITETIERRRIYVRRPLWSEPEEIWVAKVEAYETETTRGNPVDLTVHFKQGRYVWDTKQQRDVLAGNETTGSRAVFVKDILEVR